MNVLSRTPQTVEDLVERIYGYLTNLAIETIKYDAIEFYSLLEANGFVVSGYILQECYESFLSFSY